MPIDDARDHNTHLLLCAWRAVLVCQQEGYLDELNTTETMDHIRDDDPPAYEDS